MVEMSSRGKLPIKGKAASEGEQAQCLLQVSVLCLSQKGVQAACGTVLFASYMELLVRAAATPAGMYASACMWGSRRHTHKFHSGMVKLMCVPAYIPALQCCSL